MEIKFSHRYPKIHDQKTAQLLAVKTARRVEFTKEFIDYDTLFVKDDEGNFGGYFPLPEGNYIVLLFLGNEYIPFTTVRRFTEEKFKYYHSSIGKIFDIRIKKEED